MENEVLELAKKLEKQIQILEIKKGNYNPKNKWVYLQITDHYGNKGGVIQTYMNSPKINPEIEDFISEKYGEFLKEVYSKIQSEIENLKSRIENL